MSGSLILYTHNNMLTDTHTCTKRDAHLHTRGHGRLHMRTLALLWHSETHVVTA